MGVVSDYKYVYNKSEGEFLTGQVEYSQSCGCLGSCLAMEHSVRKSSMLFDDKCSFVFFFVCLFFITVLQDARIL